MSRSPVAARSGTPTGAALPARARRLNPQPRPPAHWHASCFMPTGIPGRAPICLHLPAPACRRAPWRSGASSWLRAATRCPGWRSAAQRRWPATSLHVWISLAQRRAMAGAAGAAGRAPGRAAVACRTGAALPVVGRALRRQGQHRHRRRAHHGRLPGLRLRAAAQRHRRAAAARCRRAVAGQDQPRPVRHRPGRHALALRPAEQRLRCHAHQRRLQLGLGGGRGARPGGLLRWAPTRPARAACRPASTTWSA